MPRILEGKNRASPDEAASFVDKLEELNEQLESLKIEHMNKARKVHEEIKDLLDDAKSQGVPKKVVKGIVQARKLEAKARDVRDELENDDREFFIDIRTALGDFKDSPLGAAAVDREEGQADPTTAAVLDAVQKDMTDEEREKADWDAAAPTTH